jgi:hypothetical protein
MRYGVFKAVKVQSVFFRLATLNNDVNGYNLSTFWRNMLPPAYTPKMKAGNSSKTLVITYNTREDQDLK